MGLLLGRTALRTVSRWKEWVPQLRAAADEHLPLARSSSSVPCLSPPGWDSPSFAETLWHAAHGKFQDLDVSCSPIFLGLQSGDAGYLGIHPQTQLYKVLLDILHEPSTRMSFDITLKHRITNSFAVFEMDFGNSVNLDSCISALDLISIPDKTKVIKTWLNGWATTYRIKGDFKRDCLLGCPGEPDSLAHYVMCPRIYACLLHVLPSTSDDPLARCGVANPSRMSLLAVACTFSAYHALKARINSEFDACIPQYVDMTPYWIFFAQSFSAEAGERALTRTLFDPSSFLQRFLIPIDP